METFPAFLIGLLAILLLTSFVKLFTALNILRIGIGLSGNGFAVIVGALALVLTLVVVQPQLQAAGGLDGLTQARSWSALEPAFKPFLEKHADPRVLEKFKGISKTAQKESGDKASFEVLMASFLVSELSEAFKVALLLLVPFVVIDLLVVNLLMLLNITQLQAVTVSLPLKLFLFFAVDGWTLVSDKLLQGYL